MIKEGFYVNANGKVFEVLKSFSMEEANVVYGLYTDIYDRVICSINYENNFEQMFILSTHLDAMEYLGEE